MHIGTHTYHQKLHLIGMGKTISKISEAIILVVFFLLLNKFLTFQKYPLIWV